MSCHRSSTFRTTSPKQQLSRAIIPSSSRSTSKRRKKSRWTLLLGMASLSCIIYRSTSRMLVCTPHNTGTTWQRRSVLFGFALVPSHTSLIDVLLRYISSLDVYRVRSTSTRRTAVTILLKMKPARRTTTPSSASLLVCCFFRLWRR